MKTEMPSFCLRIFLPVLCVLCVLCGCSLFGKKRDWYSGPGELRGRIENHLRNAVSVVREIEGGGSFPSAVHVAVQEGDRVTLPAGVVVIRTGVRSYFRPPNRMVFGQGPTDAEMMEECLHLVRYQAFGVLDHDPRYRAWWVGH